MQVKSYRYISTILLYAGFIIGLWLLPMLLPKFEGSTVGETGLCPFGLVQYFLLGKGAGYFNIQFWLIIDSFWFISWILSIIFIGRGFCNHVCPLGLAVQPFAKIGSAINDKGSILDRFTKGKTRYQFSRKLHDISYGFLLVVIVGTVLFGAVHTFQGIPILRTAGVFCEVCPFYCVYATNLDWFFIDMFPHWIWWMTLFVGLIIIAGLSTGGRFWCAYLCPAGALTGVLSKKSVFGVYRDKEKCIGCRECVSVCPVFLMDDVLKRDLEEIPKEHCIRCGKCVDVCKKDAISFGTKNRRGPTIHKIAASTGLLITIFWITAYIIIAII